MDLAVTKVTKTVRDRGWWHSLSLSQSSDYQDSVRFKAWLTPHDGGKPPNPRLAGKGMAQSNSPLVTN